MTRFRILTHAEAEDAEHGHVEVSALEAPDAGVL
jgi:hypothetical protein